MYCQEAPASVGFEDAGRARCRRIVSLSALPVPLSCRKTTSYVRLNNRSRIGLGNVTVLKPSDALRSRTRRCVAWPSTLLVGRVVRIAGRAKLHG